MTRSGSSLPPSRLSTFSREHRFLSAAGMVVAAVLGVLFLIASAFALHPVLGVAVVLGCTVLAFFSLVRVVGLARGSMQYGGVDRFIVQAWMRPAMSLICRVGFGTLVFAWFVVGAALSGLLAMVLDPQAIEPGHHRNHQGPGAPGRALRSPVGRSARDVALAPPAPVIATGAQDARVAAPLRLGR